MQQWIQALVAVVKHQLVYIPINSRALLLAAKYMSCSVFTPSHTTIYYLLFACLSTVTDNFYGFTKLYRRPVVSFHWSSWWHHDVWKLYTSAVADCNLASPSVLWYCWLGLLTCKNRRPYKLYCVGGDVKPCSINQSINCSATEYTPCPEKNGPPKHVKITLWIENVSDYFSLYHEMPSICNVHVKFHDN